MATNPDCFLEVGMKTMGRSLLFLCVLCLISQVNAKNILVVMSGADHLELKHYYTSWVNDQGWRCSCLIGTPDKERT
jgi:hypothetical protein